MGKLGKLVDVIHQKADSWYNAYTGLGNALRDKQMDSRFYSSRKLTHTEMSDMYHCDDMAARICEALPEEGLRKGFYLTSDGDDIEIAQQVDEYGETLEFAARLEDCAVWARVFGGAVLYLGLEDGQEEDQPLAEERIKSIRFVDVIDGRYVTPYTYYEDRDDPKWGQVETYQVLKADLPATEAIKVHETRLIPMHGARTADDRKSYNNGWSDSALQRVNDVLTAFGTTWQGVSHLMLDASQAVFKIQGLMDMIAGGDCETLQTRMELVDMSRSVARAIMLDAEHESFERQSYQFTGIPDVLKQFTIRLAAAARMPVIVLMGQSPQGLNATGESDIRLWYDRVQAYQSQELACVIKRFWRLVFLAQDFEGAEPDGWDIKFERLWQMTDKEQAELEKAVADKDKIYIDAGVLLPEEVAVSRYTARGFSADTQIDLDARSEMLEAELELAKSKAGEEPEPPPGFGQPPVASADPEDIDD